MKLTVDVDDSKLEEQIRDYIRTLLSGPSYGGGKGGFGYEAAKDAAREAVSQIDWAPMVQKALKDNVGHVVAEAVVAEIKRQASVQAKLLLRPT